MEAVKAFNQELSTLYECKPPISRAKMTQLTKSAIKAIKLYKHVVQSVEKFIQKCRPEYKVPGLYVIDSIVRQSRHQFSQEKDVFAPRFAKNIHTTFTHLFKCPPDEKAKIVRVLNLWQKNSVFSAEIIQPLLDLANPEKADSLPAVPEKTEKKRVEPEWLKEQAAQAGTEHTKKGAPSPQKKSRAHKHSSPEDKTLALVSNLLQQAQEGSSEHQQLQQLQLIQETIQKQTKSQQTRASNKETLKLDEAVLQKIQNLTKQLTSLANQGSTSAPEDKESSTPPAPEEIPPLPEEKTETSFNSALLEFDYGDEEEETETKKPSPRKATPPPEMPPLPPQMPPPQQTPPQMPPQVVSHVPPNIPPPVSLPAENPPGPPPAAPMVSNLQASLEAVQKLTDELNHAQSQQEQMQKYMQHTDQQIRQQIPPPGHPPPGHPPLVHPPPVHPPPGHPPGHPPPLPEFFHQRPPFPLPPPFQPQLPPAPQQAAEQYQPEFPSDDIIPHAVTSPHAMVSDDAPVVVIEESPPKDDGRGRSKSPRKKRSRSRSNSRSKSPHSKSRHRSKRRHRSRSRDRDRSRGRRSRSRSRERDRSRRRDREGDHRSRKDEDRERKKGFPSIKDRKASVCSLTIWLGRLPKSVTENEIRRLVEEHGGGEVKSVQIVSARGCAYVLMADRLEAAKILDNLKYAKLHGSNLKIDWAPGVGVKDKKYKDYWDVDRGVSYIPWDSFPKDPEKVDQLEEGSVFDIDSLPEEVKKLRQVQPVKEPTSEAVSESQANAIPVLPVMGTSLPLPPHPTLPSQPGVPIPPPIVSATSEAGPDVPPQPQLLHAGLPPPRMPTAPVMRMPIMPSGVLSPFMSIPPVGVRLPAGFVPGQPLGGGIPQPGGVIAAPGGLPSIPQTTPSPQSSGDTQLVTNTTTAISSPSPFSALMRPGVPLPTGPRGVDGLPTPSSLAVTQATQLLGQMPNRLMGLLPPRIAGLSLPQPIRPATDNKRLPESSSEPKGLLGNPPGLPGPLVAGMLNLAPDHMLENQLNKEEMDILAEKKADKTDDINPHLEAEKVDLGGPPLGPPPVSLMGDISQFAGPALRMVRPTNLGQAVLPQGMVPGLMQIPRMMVPGGMVRLPGQGIPVSLGGLRLATPGMLPPTSGLPRGLQQGMLPTVPPDIMNIIRPNPPVPTIETPEEEKADNPKDVDERVIPDYNASSPFQGEDPAEGMFGNGPAPEKTKEDEDFRKDRDLREPWPRLRGAPDFGPRGPPPLMADFQRGPRPWGPPFRGPPPRGMPPRGLPPGGPPLRGPPPPREGFGPDGWGRDQDWRRGPPPPLDPDFPGPREDKDWRSSGPQHWERGRGFFPDGQDREERGFGREPRRDFDHRRDRDRERDRDFDRDRDRSFDRERDRDHRRERDHDYRVRDRDSERGRDRKEDGSKSFSKEKPTSEQSNDSSDKSRRKSRWAPVANEEPKPLLDIVIPPLMPKTRQLSAPSPLMEEKPKTVSVTPTPLVKSAPSEAAEAPKEVKSTETVDSPGVPAAKVEKDETTTPHPEKQVPEPKTAAAAENETKAKNEEDPTKDTTSEAGQNSIEKVEKDASEKA